MSNSNSFVIPIGLNEPDFRSGYNSSYESLRDGVADNLNRLQFMSYYAIAKTKAAGASIKEVAGNFREDASNFDIKDAVNGAGSVAMKVAGGLQGPNILTMTAATTVSQEAGSTSLTSIAAAAAVGVVSATMNGTWSYGSAKVYNRTVESFRATFSKAGEKLPAEELSQKLTMPVDGEHGRLRRTVDSGTRGLTISSGVGILPYVLTAGALNLPSEKRESLWRQLGKDNGRFMGVVATASTAALIQLHNSDPALADKIASKSHDPGTLLKALVLAKIASNIIMPPANWLGSKLKPAKSA